MTKTKKAQLQLAIDVLSVDDALQIGEAVYPHFDIAEIGKPLIIEAGMAAVECLKERFPDKQYLADLKIMDAGFIEASSGFARGADIVTVLAAADDSTISNALEAAAKYDGKIMVDLINVADPISRAQRLQQLGVEMMCVHTAYDRQAPGVDPLAELLELRAMTDVSLGVAGGLKLDNVKRAVDCGADIVVVGGAIITHENPGAMSEQIMRKIQEVA